LIASTAIQLQRNLLHREFWLQLIVGRILPIAVPLLAWRALFDYTGAAELQGWDKHEMSTYYIIVFFISLFASIDFNYEMSSMVHKGTLSQWLLRPLSFFETAASHILARILMLLIPGLLIILIGVLMIPDFPSRSPELSLMSAFAVLPFSIIMFGILSAAVGLISFWTMHTESVFALILLILEFFGGRLLPLELLPAWLRPLSDFLPLRYAISLPAEAILNPGQYSILLIFGGQIFWCLALLLAAMFLWRIGLKRYDAVGG